MLPSLKSFRQQDRVAIFGRTPMARYCVVSSGAVHGVVSQPQGFRFLPDGWMARSSVRVGSFEWRVGLRVKEIGKGQLRPGGRLVRWW